MTATMNWGGGLVREKRLFLFARGSTAGRGGYCQRGKETKNRITGKGGLLFNVGRKIFLARFLPKKRRTGKEECEEIAGRWHASAIRKRKEVL